MLRNKSNRTRSQILGLQSRNDNRTSLRDVEPMTPDKIAMEQSSYDIRTPESAARSPHGFKQHELVELKQAFRLFDTEQKGSILVGIFRSVLESLKEEDAPIFSHLDQILDQLVDVSDEQTLSFDDYLSLMANTSAYQRSQIDKDGNITDFQHIFDLYDADGKGFITIEDLRRVVIDLGEMNITMEELQEMINRASSKKTGKVTVKEFSKMMKLNLFQAAENDGNNR